MFENEIQNKTSLTNTDRYLLKKINEDLVTFQNYTMSFFAQKHSLSNSSLSRISRKLNFTSYKHMQIYTIKNANNVYGNKEKIKSDNIEINQLEKIYIKTLNETKSNINIENIVKASNIIYNSKQIMLYGVGSSCIAIEHLSNSLNRLNIKSKIFNNVYQIIPIIVYLLEKKEKAALFIVSKELKTKEVRWLIKKCLNTNIKIICITSKKETVRLNLDCLLISSHFDQEIRIFSLTSKISNLFIIDSILLNLSKICSNILEKNKFDALIKDWNK